MTEKCIELGEIISVEECDIVEYRYNTETRRIESFRKPCFPKRKWEEVWKESFEGKTFSTLEEAEAAFKKNKEACDYNRWLIDTICSM